ncbi:MAG: cysteine hydrolase, partial [Planctomycetes bacterium]|nr:cysteine hydrolase [Planctomycetota bacterium]
MIFQAKLEIFHPLRRSILVVIDPQNYFVNEFTQSLPGKISTLLGSGVFPHYRITQFINLTNSSHEKFLSWNQMKSGREIEIVSELEEFTHDKTLIKHSYSIFTPEFESVLKSKDVENIYFTGFDTEVCILINASIAYDKCFEPFILTKYCASHTGTSEHLAALLVLSRIIRQHGLV